MGHSGSEKSTLINILGLIDTFDSGKYDLYGINVLNFNDKDLFYLRMKIYVLFYYYLYTYNKSKEDKLLLIFVLTKIKHNIIITA